MSYFVILICHNICTFIFCKYFVLLYFVTLNMTYVKGMTKGMTKSMYILLYFRTNFYIFYTSFYIFNEFYRLYAQTLCF